MSDKYFSSVQLLLGFNGSDGATSTTDESGTPKTINWTGNTQLDTARAKFGSAALLLDGNGDWVSASDAGVNLSSSKYTIEFWAYLDQANYNAAGGEAARGLFSTWVGQGSSRVILYVWPDGSFRVTEQGASGTPDSTIVSAAAVIPLQQWFYVAVTRDDPSSAGTVRLFIDGVIVASATGVTARSDHGDIAIIGAFAAGGSFNWSWNGSIDEFRLTKGVARYTSAFNPPRGPFSRGKRVGVLGEYAQAVIAYR